MAKENVENACITYKAVTPFGILSNAFSIIFSLKLQWVVTLPLKMAKIKTF